MKDDVNSDDRNKRHFLIIYVITIDDMKIKIIESVTHSLCWYLQRDAALTKNS